MRQSMIFDTGDDMTGLTKGVLTQTFENKAEPGTYELTDFMISVAHLHEKAEELNKKAFHYGQLDEGAEKISLIAQTNQPKEHGPKFGSTERNKKFKEALELIKFQSLLNDLAEMRTQMDNLLADILDAQRQIKEGLEILRNKDIDEARRYLLDEFGIDAERMTDEEILDTVAEKVGDTMENQEDLLRLLEEKVRDYMQTVADNPELEDQYLPQYLEEFEKLKKQAEQNNLDFNEARKNLLLKVGDVKLLKEVDDGYEKESRINVETTSTNPFAVINPGAKL